MGAGTQPLQPLQPRRENAHFLSLLAVGAVMVTVFFLFVGTTHHSSPYVEGGPELNLPTSRSQYLEREPRMQAWSESETGGNRFGGGRISSNGRGTLAATREKTLVVYLYDRSDPVYQNNLNYFLRQAIPGWDGCDYVFVTQGADNPQVANALPRLPKNAVWFYSRQSSCIVGLGLVAELFASGTVKKADYNYFVILNSSVRGPFIPGHSLEDRHWSQYFTQRISGRVKLVGPTISCQAPAVAVQGEVGEAPPHVQFSALATDQIGLGIIEAEGRSMQCYESAADALSLSVMGASAAILKANYSIDSFMARYRRVDWLDKKNWGCNQRLDPLLEFSYDGLSVHPYEVMFVPMSTVAIENGWSFARLAAQYETWSALQLLEDNNVNGNAWVTDPWPIKRQRIAYMQSRGPGCFDNRYYLQKNADLKVIPTALELWDHFVMMGQFEGRSFRWSCEDDRKLPWET